MLVLVAIGALAAGGFASVPAAAASAGSDTRDISASGTSSFSVGRPGSAAVQNLELAQTGAVGRSAAGATPSAPTIKINRSKTDGKSAAGSNSSESRKEGSNSGQVISFDGLNHFAQRTANNGNQFSLEPPDQGLCTGNGFVLETINDVLAVYNQSGNLLMGPVDLNTFYGYRPAVIRSVPVFGPELTDPSCYFDVATQRWFHVVLTLDVFSDNGRFKGTNHLDLAVSGTADPLGEWTIYRVPVQDDGTQKTPNHHCSTGDYPVKPTNPHACFGDYPHIGADANGFYITTNEYSFFGPEFKAAQIYAFSKRALAANKKHVAMRQFDTTALVGGTQAGFTLWPAEAPNGRFNASQRAIGATEFFLSSNAAAEVNASLSSRDLIVWALTNTQSLDSAHPALSLSNKVLTVNRYAAPPLSTQKAGPLPLRDCINDTTLDTPYGPGCWQLLFVAEPGHNEVLSSLDSNDTRMQQVMYANGVLYGALDTALEIKGKAQAGIEWFAVRPQLTSSGVDATLVKQGYLGAAGANLTYPALAVNENGVGAMGFTLVGPNDFPSAAYASFDLSSGTGSIHVAAAGVGPDDGFSGYVAFGPPFRTRWGDYGAAVVDGSKVWIASEYIGQTCTFGQWLLDTSCGGTRTALANWDTRITAIAIGGSGEGGGGGGGGSGD